MNGLINNIQLIISLIQIQFNIFMKSLTTYINEKMVYNKSTANKIKYNYYPKTKEELKKLIIQLAEERCNEGDFNDIDTSKITNMSDLFEGMTKFNGNISNWDVSNVTNMESMFYSSNFNGDISKWNVSNVTNMKFMFRYSKFNSDISKWDVSNVTNNIDIFYNCPITEKYKPNFKK